MVRPAGVRVHDAAPDWPEDHQVRIELELNKKPPGKKYRRPYLAVWIEDAKGRRVRTVTVRGRKSKYLKTLTGWWKEAPRDKDDLKAITRATRSGGRYLLVWDGRDDEGRPLPRGTYIVRIDVHREHGRHYKDMAGKIECGGKPAEGKMKGNVEIRGVRITYGPKGE